MTKIKPNANFHVATNKSVFDVRKEDNFIEYRRRWYAFPSNFIVGDFPVHLDIESTNICNLNCHFCATTFERWGSAKRGIMDMKLFKKIVDEGTRNGLYSIKLSLRGEPLLHPQISEMIKYARQKGIIDIYFNTNGLLLNEDMINKLLDAGLFRISISVEGTTKEVYEKHRRGSNFEEVLNNIKNLRKIRDDRKLLFPQIRVQTVLLDELKESFPDYVKFWGAFADEVSYLDARSESSDSNYRPKQANWACPFLWQRMTILWDGTILPCLAHGIKDVSPLVLGNAGEESIKKAWDSEVCKRLRELHKSGESHRMKACVECSYRTMEIDKQV